MQVSADQALKGTYAKIVTTDELPAAG